MAISVPQQRITFYQDDEVTPVIGLGPEAGEPQVGSFSTDRTHDRPHLVWVADAGGSEVRLLEGGSTIGTATAEIVDAPRTAGDQASGYVPHILADETQARTRLLGRRARLEQRRPNGTWFVLLDGVVQAIGLNDDWSSFRVQLRDVRERERKLRAFVRADTTSVFPPGTIQPFGRLTPWSGPGFLGARYLIPVVTPIAGRFLLVPGRTDAGVVRGIDDAADPFGQPVTRGFPAFQYSKDGLAALEALGAYAPVYRDDGSYAGQFYDGVVVQWRPVGGSAWTTLRHMPFVDAPLTRRNVFARAYKPAILDHREQRFVAELFVTRPADAALPANGQDVEVRVLSNRPPSEAIPIVLETDAGTLLKELYDGRWTDEDGNGVPEPTGIRYDPVAMQRLIDAAHPVFLLLTAPIEDVRAWTEEHLYRAFGYAPAIDVEGRIAPISTELPDDATPICTLDHSVIDAVGSTWAHDATEAITEVEFIYRRYALAEPEQDVGVLAGSSALERLTYTEVMSRRVRADSAARLGRKPYRLVPVTVASVVGSLASSSVVATGDGLSEIGARWARERAELLLTRFGEGAQRIVLPVRQGDAPAATGALIRDAYTNALRPLAVGDWCVVAAGWMPDYGARRRGLSRLAQVRKIRPLDPVWDEVTLVDAGPDGQPVGLPTLGAPYLVNDGAGQRVRVQIIGVPTSPAGRPPAVVHVQYAQGDAKPDPSSARWMLLSYDAGIRDVDTPPVAEGSTVWVRARGEAGGRRSSGWVDAGSVVVPAVARLARLALSLTTDFALAIEWAPSLSARGLRVRFVDEGIGTALPDVATMDSAAFLDLDATIGRAVLPVTLAAGRQLAVRVDPYTGWTGTSVAGTKGPSSDVQALARAAPTPTTPYALVSVRQVDATDEEVTVEVTSPLAGAAVELVALGGSAIVSGRAIGVDGPSPSTWVFARPAAYTAPGSALFAAHRTGAISDTDSMVITEQGRESVPLRVEVILEESGPTTAWLRATVTDPVPGPPLILQETFNDGSAGIGTFEFGGVLDVEGATHSIASGASARFRVTRPTYGLGLSRMHWRVFSVVGTRTADSDAFDLAEAPAFAHRGVLGATQADDPTVSTLTVTSFRTAPNDAAATLTDQGGGTTLLFFREILPGGAGMGPREAPVWTGTAYTIQAGRPAAGSPVRQFLVAQVEDQWTIPYGFLWNVFPQS